MATSFVDPVTGIVIPIPGAEPGPLYADDVSDALLTVAHLTHTGPENQDGYQIPSAGLNINADLSFQSHNLVDLRSTRYTVQSSPLNGPGDRAAVYFSGVDLYANDANGIPVRITGGGALNVTVSNNYVPKSITSNYTIQPTDGYEFFYINTTANRLITLPLANNVPKGRFFIFKDITGTAFTHNVTINCSGADRIDGASSYVMKGAYSAICLVGDGVAAWELLKYDQVIYKTGESLTFDTGSNLNLNNGSVLTATLGTASAIHLTGSSVTLDGYSTTLINQNSLVSLSGNASLVTSGNGNIDITNSKGITVDGYNGIQLNVAGSIEANFNHAIELAVKKSLYTKAGSNTIALGGTSADIGFENTQTIIRNVNPRVIGNLPSNWSTNFAGPYSSIYVPTTTSTQFVLLEIPYLLDGQTLNSVTVYFRPATHTQLPQHYPSLDVRCTNTIPGSVPGSDFSLNTGAPIFPTASTLVAYNALTSWTFPCNQAQIINHANYMYYMILTDENGTNSVPGGTYYGFQLNYSVTDMRIA